MKILLITVLFAAAVLGQLNEEIPNDFTNVFELYEEVIEQATSTAGPATTSKQTTARPATTKQATTKPTKPATTKPATIKPATTKPATTKRATTKPATTKPATTKPSTTKPATTKPATTKPATTKPATTKPATTKPVTTKKATTVKPTGKVECKKELISCVRRTPFWFRYRCVIRYRECLWRLCPVSKCFDTLDMCLDGARSLREKFMCLQAWKKCMKSHVCPKYIYSF